MNIQRIIKRERVLLIRSSRRENTELTLQAKFPPGEWRICIRLGRPYSEKFAKRRKFFPVRALSKARGTTAFEEYKSLRNEKREASPLADPCHAVRMEQQ